MPRLSIEYTEQDLKQLVLRELQDRYPDIPLALEHIRFQVKSKNNYRQQEWEDGRCQILVDHTF